MPSYERWNSRCLPYKIITGFVRYVDGRVESLIIMCPYKIIVGKASEWIWGEGRILDRRRREDMYNITKSLQKASLNKTKALVAKTRHSPIWIALSLSIYIYIYLPNPHISIIILPFTRFHICFSIYLWPDRIFSL